VSLLYLQHQLLTLAALANTAPQAVFKPLTALLDTTQRHRLLLHASIALLVTTAQKVQLRLLLALQAHTAP
jgi:hypothetical protein